MKLSVLIITYNHEKFIGQAIDGALSQKTDFDYEIVVGEDCSTDSTREIVADYEHRYPDKVRLLDRDHNVGANRNFALSLKECRGDYVATLDGDDYWTSPRKLQKQMDFLTQNPDCVICFHDVRDHWEDGSRDSHVLVLKLDKAVSTIEDLLQPGCFLPNSSVVIKNSLIDSFPDWYYDLPLGDWPMHVLCARSGKIGYINEVMGVYRRHPDGALLKRKVEEFWQGELKMYQGLNSHLGGRYDKFFRVLASRRYYMLAAHSEAEGDMPKARSYARRRLRACPLDTNCELPIRHVLRLYAPRSLGKLSRALRKAVGK